MTEGLILFIAILILLFCIAFATVLIYILISAFVGLSNSVPEKGGGKSD